MQENRCGPMGPLNSCAELFSAVLVLPEVVHNCAHLPEIAYLSLPFHGGNTGSNPVRDANFIWQCYQWLAGRVPDPIQKLSSDFGPILGSSALFVMMFFDYAG
ncbi:hypothetical protein GOB93_12755 [Acetobacter musti]|uniref:Uncharacterized protein n=1 Tax=Acetobacter musti TaxID=864732 RepID=A0ABX0JU61_9PROT|nr:hypothetical protein [Acetobacter musti]NHN85505.1 hypothetical protein [Acetobacter musti]